MEAGSDSRGRERGGAPGDAWREPAKGQAVSNRSIRSGEILKTARDSCHSAQYCPNEVSSLRTVAFRNIGVF